MIRFASLGLPELTAHGSFDPPNRRMQTRMSGRVAGRVGDRSPYADLLPVVGAIATVTLVLLVPTASRSTLLFVFFAVFTLGICGHNYSPLQLILESSAVLSNIQADPISPGKSALSRKSLASSDSSKFRNENTEKT